MSIKWIETSPEAYREVYRAHQHSLIVFGTYTHCDEPEELLTEWGFYCADYAVIKSHKLNGEWKYYLACVTNDD